MVEGQDVIGNVPEEDEAGPLAQARMLLRENRPAEAVQLLQAMVEGGLGSAAVYQELALALFKALRYGPAAKAARRALEIDPSLPRPHGILAWVALNGGRYDEAEAELRAQLEALSADDVSQQAAALNQLGFLYFSQKRYDEAEEALAEALALDSARPIPRLNLALLHLRIKQWEQARRGLEQLVSMPELPKEVIYTARFNLGHLYARQGRYSDAREQFAQAAAVHRTAPATLFRAVPFLARVPVSVLTAIVVIGVVIIWNLFLRR